MLASQTVNVSGNVFRLASPSDHMPEPVNFGNFHVGDSAPSQLLSITNNVANDGFSESLNGSIGSPTGGVTTNAGSFTGLLPSATNSTSLSVGFSTATPGDKSGTAAISLTSDGTGSSGLPDTVSPSQTVNVTGNVYRLASALAHTPEPVNFGIVHVGDVAQQALTVSNTAPNDGFSERLNGSLSNPTGSATTSGSFSNLTPGATNDTSLLVGINTATAGTQSGAATLALESTGAGTSGLPNTSFASQTVNVQAQVNNFADPSLSQTGGSGVLQQSDATHYDLHFSARLAPPTLTASLSLANAAPAPADTLAGAWDTVPASFTLSGFDPLSNLAAGSSLGGLQVQLSAVAAGTYNGSATLHPRSQNSGGFDGALPDLQLAISGLVVVEGDFDRDNVRTNFDIQAMLDALVDVAAYKAAHQLSNADMLALGDINNDNQFNPGDILPFLTSLTTGNFGGGALANVPEPPSLLLAVCAMMTACCWNQRPRHGRDWRIRTDSCN